MTLNRVRLFVYS